MVAPERCRTVSPYARLGAACQDRDIQEQQIESVEPRITTAVKQLIELAAPLLIQADNLTVQQGTAHFQFRCETLAEHRKALEPIPIA